MKSATKIDIKSKVTELYDITNEASDFISSLQTAFIYNSSKHLLERGPELKAIETKIDTLSAIFREAAEDDERMGSYTAVPEHLSHVWKKLNTLYDLINKKIRENVLFSDKAVNETMYLLQRLVEILRPTADMILARNSFLGRYVEESQVNIVRMANDYATLHENRLITGECLPIASSIYVDMLEAIKSVAWHTKEIAAALGK